MFITKGAESLPSGAPTSPQRLVRALSSSHHRLLSLLLKGTADRFMQGSGATFPGVEGLVLTDLAGDPTLSEPADLFTEVLCPDGTLVEEFHFLKASSLGVDAAGVWCPEPGVVCPLELFFVLPLFLTAEGGGGRVVVKINGQKTV